MRRVGWLTRRLKLFYSQHHVSHVSRYITNYPKGVNMSETPIDIFDIIMSLKGYEGWQATANEILFSSRVWPNEGVEKHLEEHGFTDSVYFTPGAEGWQLAKVVMR